MEKLELIRIRDKASPFRQYLPGNLEGKPEDASWVCVGAVYGGSSCGAAAAELTEDGAYLRYIFVDPAARLCGLGTYLLRGLLGEVRKTGAELIKAVYTPGMLENGGQTPGILERAGFTRPKPVATEISVRLGDIRQPEQTPPEGCEIYFGKELPEKYAREYLRGLEFGEIPPYADVDLAADVIPELCAFCALEGAFAGVLVVRERDGGIFASGVYVMERFRGERVTSALIAAAVGAARRLYPGDTEVSTQNTTRMTIDICYKLFGSRSITLKETEFMSVCEL